MQDNAPTPRPGSLDELLAANKKRFDELFDRSLGASRLVRADVHPPSRADLASASMESTGSADTTVAEKLNALFGNGWSNEIVEHSAERDRVSVLVKLTVGDISRMQFGEARIRGDKGAAMQNAVNRALELCAEQIPAVEPQATGTDVAPAAKKGTPAKPAMSGERPRPAPGADPKPAQKLDPITLDLIENALRNARHEMDAVLFRSAMSPVIREQHDEFPMITDAKGRMIVGQFGSYIAEMLKDNSFTVEPGDVILQSDPYKCGGAISHINDWMVMVPIFFEGELVGFTSMFGHMMDVGGSVPGSMPTNATTIFAEGIRIPPVKIYAKGELNQAALDILMSNTRTPEMNYSDLMAIVAGCRAGERRVIGICERFGSKLYHSACEALLERTNRAMRQLIVQNLPEEPQSFEDYIDDDGCGNGPFKMKLTVWREGDQAYFDWTGTSAQAPGPINFYLHEGMFKMFIGVYMIMVFDPQILFNDGFYDIIHVTMPKGSLVNPEFPAALGCRTHALSRQFDVLGGALSYNAPEMATAAGYGSSPYFIYSGNDDQGRPFQLMEILYGGIPGRPIGDGMDGHSWWPLFENIPSEYLENFYPIMVEGYTSIIDTGGAGKHRGGNGVEKIFKLMAAGHVSIHDDRSETQPWGILGGKPGQCSEKYIIRSGEKREPLPSKIDNIKVSPGDLIIFRTAGGGGWGDALERDPKRVRNDVVRKLMSIENARENYGVVLTGTSYKLDLRATEDLRISMERTRKPLELFNFGEHGAHQKNGRMN
jgi:N-methylhydantoinase B